MTSSPVMAAAETLASVAATLNHASSSSSSSSNEPKKRTRPVSACEACRAKKVRCILAPDAPVCQNCLSSGKQCLFRVDDLAPALRAARFAHLGPPTPNTRTIASKKSKSKTNPLPPPPPPAKRPKTESQQPEAKPKQKNKAVFRSFANPTKLAAPQPIPNTSNGFPTSNGHGHGSGQGQGHGHKHGQSSSLFDSNSSVLLQQHSPDQPMSNGFAHHHHQHSGASVGSPAKHRSSVHSVHSDENSRLNVDVDPMSLAYYGHVSPPSSHEQQQHIGRPSTSAAVPGSPPPPPVSAELRDDIHRWQRDRLDSTATEIDERTQQQQQTLTDSMPPPKPKIMLPFFRWFGTTANTPGYRKIKVGVLQDPEVPGSDDLSPALAAQASDQGRSAGSFSIHDDEQPVPSPSDAFWLRSPRPHTPPSSKGDRAPSSATRDLFEINRPRYPRRDILEHLVELFLSHFKPSWCPWMDSNELRTAAENGSMPAVLANSICALSARFSERAELRRHPRQSSGEHFSDMAKVLLIPLLSFPSIEVIETLLILSYAEFAAGSDSGLWMYVGMALRMAQDLGLQHEAGVLSSANPRKARLLFWAVVSLDRVTTFGTGRPVTIRESEIDTNLPDEETLIFTHIIRTLLLRGRMGELLNRQDESVSQEERKRALTEMWLELAQSYAVYPASLHFNVQTFQQAAVANESPAFMYLHVLFQSTIGLLDRFSVPASGGASRTIADMLTLGDVFDDRCITASPYLDQLILPAGRALLSSGQPYLSACLSILSKLATFWAGASWPLRALEHEAHGKPLTSDPQNAHIRDVEIVLQWAKDRNADAEGGLFISTDLTFDTHLEPTASTVLAEFLATDNQLQNETLDQDSLALFADALQIPV